MGSRAVSHQLSSGLLVSGRPEQLKEKQPTMSSRAVPYTGGDVKKSGDLGKMFDIAVVDRSSTGGGLSNSNPNSKQQSLFSQPSRSSSSSQPNSGSIRSGSNSGPIRKSSGPLPLQPTGLITSGPRRSGQLGQAEQTSVVSGKSVYGPAMTNLREGVKYGFGVSKAMVWVVMVVVAMGLLVGAFLMVAIKKVLVLGAVGAVVVPMGLGLAWNCIWGRKGLLGASYLVIIVLIVNASYHVISYMIFIQVVTCGSIPLESSYQQVARCVYVSTELYEYKGWGGKSSNPKHRCFSWGCSYSENYVADFYISDFQSGLRALVKAGYGAKVAPFVEPATVVDITKENKDLSPSFLSWLAERKLSSDDLVQRHDNVLMIIPPSEPISTRCQWIRCLLPMYVEGLILTCDDNQNADVVPV
ncbi:hypothetical protein CXB51_027046 [Gossypium anomalum]|uniref:Uncharacterized protein n=1 Tax=Gossypium anomalum TaxID=47600 RepID=A0A8J6CRM5_9ROSI|nr:hypothetical protein CXB51_027046 [Gossypium anomalum]